MLRVDKGKGKACTQDEGVMDVDVDVVATDTGAYFVCVPLPPASGSADPSPSTSFAQLSIVSTHHGTAGPRPVCIAVDAIANVEVLQHWDGAAVPARRQDERKSQMLVGEAVSLAVDTVLPLVDVGPLPRLCFIDPVVKDDSELPPTESPAGVHAAEETEDDDPLMATHPCLRSSTLGYVGQNKPTCVDGGRQGDIGTALPTLVFARLPVDTPWSPPT
ncbi:hypothetical protein B0H13DRAFT_1900434 [Mycena leptocephala]|nr:hypothetical protein B0H13DRAFT_1900434 [Mycena leptocephala]